MKMLKKLFAFVAAFAMLLALPTTVLAEGEATKQSGATVTINKATGKYAIYQVFTGEYDAETKNLSNIAWGESINKFIYISISKTEDEQTEFIDSDASKIAEYLATKENDSDEVKNFAKKAILNIKK